MNERLVNTKNRPLFRFYDPNLQRWINRDPIAEWGGLNLYSQVRNDPLNAADAFGLMDSITLGVLGCIRSGGDPAWCICVAAAPDIDECVKSLGDCLKALLKGLPSPTTGAPGSPPSPVDLCKCGCSAIQDDTKAVEDCKKACEAANSLCQRLSKPKPPKPPQPPLPKPVKPTLPPISPPIT
jgi:hypothetical protein